MRHGWKREGQRKVEGMNEEWEKGKEGRKGRCQ